MRASLLQLPATGDYGRLALITARSATDSFPKGSTMPQLPGEAAVFFWRIRAQYIYYTTSSMLSNLNMQRCHCTARLVGFANRRPGAWHSIVTERKQLEIRNWKFLRDAIFRKFHQRPIVNRLTFSSALRTPIQQHEGRRRKPKETAKAAGSIRKEEGGSSPMANFKDPIHHWRFGSANKKRTASRKSQVITCKRFIKTRRLGYLANV